jgi:outer membrane autotransporter protein
VAGDAVHFTGGVNSLEIQSGSTITGNVVAFSTADTLKLGGATSDSFDVSQIGAGVQYQGFGIYEKTGTSTWTLTGTTTAVTPWTISAGTLAISADDNLGAAGGGLTFDGGTLQNTAAFSTARTMVLNAGGGTLQTDADFTASGMISGPGVLTKTGAGTLTLAADNTYTGGTTISAGTLQLGNGGAAGSVGSGNVVNNGTLAFDRSDTALDVNGAISGTGNVEQIGSGTTVLTGDSTYTGGTTISAGTLQLGNGGTAGSISGDVTDNGTLAFDRSDTANFGGTITGAGAISQIGTGTTLLTGDSSVFAGATNVQSGILSANGSLGGTMNVLSGGTLQGNGTVDATTVMSGGTIAPGNSIGTLHVIGPYVQNSGSTYQVQLDPNSTASDLIAVNGTATLQPGSVLSATKGVPGNYSAGTIYHVLNASSGVTGTYMLAGGGAVSAFLSLVDTYDTNNAYLTVTQTGDPGDAAQTPNQTATAGGANGTSLENPLLNSPTDAAARDALDALSGELYASSAGRMLDDSRFVREAALDRTRAAFDCDAGALTAHADTDDSSGVNRCTPNAGRATVWTRGFGSWGGFDGDGNAASLDRDIGGLFVGADVPVAGNWRVGGLLGFSRSHFSADARNSSAMSDDYHVAAYGGTQRGALDVRLGAAYAWHDINGNRSVVLPGIADAAQADYRAHTTQVFGEVGYRLKPRSGVRLEPFAGLAYVNLDSNGFQEQGGASALRVSGADANVTYTTLGVHAATLFHSDAGAQVAAHGTLGWRHAFGNRVPETTLAFDGGSSFTIAGVPIARDTLVAEVGFDMALAKDTTLGVSYSGQIADDVQDHGVRVDLTWKF